MNTCDKYVSLKWEDFYTSLPLSYQDSRLSQEFCDVTLVCDDDTSFEAHRVILVAGSVFFRNVLSSVRTSSHPHPLLYLKDFHKGNLMSMLDFIYSGETTIQEENLNCFLTQAQKLGIKGLTEESNVTKTESQNYPEETKLTQMGTTDNKDEFKLEQKQNTTEIKQHFLIDKTDDLRVTIDALQKKLLKQEANIPSKWILQNVSTFPKLPMPLKKLLFSANTLRPYTTLVMDWFLKPLGLKPGRNSFAGWEFRVNPADFIYTKNLLKELEGFDFSLKDIIEWNSLASYRS